MPPSTARCVNAGRRNDGPSWSAREPAVDLPLAVPLRRVYRFVTPAAAGAATVARVSSVNVPEDIIEVGELIIRPAQFTVTARGRVLTLSRREYDLLLVLSTQPGRVVPRERLYQQVWGRTMEARDRSVDVYVHKLRAKLAAALPEWAFIHTHQGFGYRFGAERSQDVHTSATGQ